MFNSHNKAKILIVDDDINSGIILNEYLTTSNYNIYSLNNGKNVLKWVKENKPDLILLDIIMPEISGFEVCNILKKDKKTRNIPILFISSLFDSDSHKKAMEFGAKGFILKPFNEKLVKAYIKLFL